jgi:thiaminase (transcriptional activator TenA)
MSGTASLTERLRESCAADWADLHAHPFVRELADGTLPPDTFRFYVEQNLQYLPEYARAMALGASRADDLATMRVFAADLANVVESEIPQNEELRRRAVELGARDLGGADGPAPATLAYTSFLMATAARFRPLELMAAILPCTWSYGEIAARLVGDAAEHPVYTGWIRFFGSADYARIVGTMRADLEQRATGADAQTVERLTSLFATGTRLERDFWDMAYGLEHWPDVRARYPPFSVV